MKISINWIKQFTEVDLPIDELVKKIGQQLGAVEEVIDVGARYRGIVVASVVSCEKHPNADKLSLCLIDDGGVVTDIDRNQDGHVQVVCGAPNVESGMRVVWLPPGATVPSSYDKEPFVLEARELRGKVSNGMLASAAELAIGDDHNGIVEVDIDAELGSDFAAVYELDDYVIDIETKMFTHRPDCFGMLGVAREIAGIQDKKFTSPDWYTSDDIQLPLEAPEKLPLGVENNASELVPRFMAVALAGVNVGQSPLIIRTYLSRLGIRPINNIVDITNYIMLLTGQPLHAYDYDKLQKLQDTPDGDVTLETRLSKKGETLSLLNGKDLTIDDSETVLITSNDIPVGIGGIMGGAGTEVDETTTRIVLECANFDMYSIRRASMRHGLFTDAATRFTKGQSPLQNNRALRESVAMLQYLAGAQVASNVVDDASLSDSDEDTIAITADFINARLGLSVSAEDVVRVLKNVEFDVRIGAESIVVKPPFWRTDISIAEDIVEEIGRLIGYDLLPLELPNRTLAPVQRNDYLDLLARIRELLSSAGGNELLTYSFVSGDLLKKNQQDPEKAFRVINALSPGLEYYRMSLTPSLLEKVHPNIKQGYDEFLLFELGKTHVRGLTDQDEPNLPAEKPGLSMVFAADDKKWDAKERGAAYYQGVCYLDRLLGQLGVECQIRQLDHKISDDATKQLWAPFDEHRSGAVRTNDTQIGVVGELNTSVRQALKLPHATVAIELDLALLLKFVQTSSYTPLSRYPKVQQDISLKLPAHHSYQDVYGCVAHLLDGYDDITLRVDPLDNYQSKKDASSKHLAFRITAVSNVRTLTDTEVSKILDNIATRAHEKLAAERL